MTAHFKSELFIAETPSKVWRALTDFSAYRDWNPMLKSASGTVAVGRTLVIEIRGVPFPIKTQIRAVTEARELRWGGGIPVLLDVEHYFVLQPENDGVNFVHGETFGGLLGPLIARLAKINVGLYAQFNQKIAEQAASL